MSKGKRVITESGKKTSSVRCKNGDVVGMKEAPIPSKALFAFYENNYDLFLKILKPVIGEKETVSAYNKLNRLGKNLKRDLGLRVIEGFIWTSVLK